MPSQESSGVVQIGAWSVHPMFDSISRGTETQKLEPRAMRLLMCLANSAGDVVSVKRLLTEVWADVVVEPASVYQAVSHLRKVRGDIDSHPTYIATVPRKGYRLIAPVQRVTEAPHTAQAQAVLRKAPSLQVRVIITGAVAAVAVVAAYFLIDKGRVSRRETTVAGAVVSDKSIAVLPFVEKLPKQRIRRCGSLCIPRRVG